MIANDGGEPALETEAWLLVRVESSSYIGGLGGSDASGGRDGSGMGSRQRVPQPQSSDDGSGSGVGRRQDPSGSSSGSGSGSGWMSNAQNTKLLLVFCIAIVLLVVIVCVVALLYLKYYYFDVSPSASGDRRTGSRRGAHSRPGGELYSVETLDAEKRALDLSNNAGSNMRDRRCLPMSQHLLQGGGSLRSNRDHVVPAVGATLQSAASRSRTGTAVGVRGLPPQAQTIFVPIGPGSDRSRSVTPSRSHAVAVKRPDAVQVLIQLQDCKFMIDYELIIYIDKLSYLLF